MHVGFLRQLNIDKRLRCQPMPDVGALWEVLQLVGHFSTTVTAVAFPKDAHAQGRIHTRLSTAGY